MEIHPTAAAGFSAAAEAYERARPGYPDEAVAWLADRLEIRPGRDVLDIAAGTGKLTRQLVPLGARVVAVEPLDAMRAQLEMAIPSVEALPGTAEAIPLADGSVDVVTCAQAFHWFDAEAALREMHRVLRPGGGVGLVWNSRDPADPLQAEISVIIGDGMFDQGERELRTAVDRSGLFGEIEGMACAHEQRLSLRELVDRIASVSFVAALPDGERGPVLEQVQAAAAGVPEPIRFVYVTEVFAFDRLA